MTGTQIWSENNLLREKLAELQLKYEAEREHRLNLQAENLWLKRILRQADPKPLPISVEPPAVKTSAL